MSKLDVDTLGLLPQAQIVFVLCLNIYLCPSIAKVSFISEFGIFFLNKCVADMGRNINLELLSGLFCLARPI